MKFLKRFAIALVVIFPIAIYISSRPDTTPPDTPEQSAFFNCLYYAKLSFTTLDDVKFDYQNYIASQETKSIWQVKIYVTGKNAFNATIKVPLVCTLENKGKNWELIKLVQVYGG